MPEDLRREALEALDSLDAVIGSADCKLSRDMHAEIIPRWFLVIRAAIDSDLVVNHVCEEISATGGVRSFTSKIDVEGE